MHKRVMRIHRAYWCLPRDALFGAVAIGNFDGVHRGHRVLIEAVKREAARVGGPSAVLTFEPHPREVLMPERAPRRLTPLRTKAELLEMLGVDHLFALHFNQNLRTKTPQAFVHDVLAGGLGVRHVVIGYDFRFGYKAAGDATTLEALGREYEFGVSTVPAVQWQEAVCSSSRIRDAIAAGDVGQARELLGYPYIVEGRVVPGDRRGRDRG